MIVYGLEQRQLAAAAVAATDEGSLRSSEQPIRILSDQEP
jgi:hypothetical protein